MNIGVRYFIALAIGVFATFLLFAVMIGLIKTGQQPVASDLRFNTVDFIRARRERDLNLDQVRPEPPPLPAAPPPPTQLPMENIATATETFVAGIDEMAPDGFSITPGFSAGEGGGDYLPIVQVAPQYPRQALQDGIEGWVLVEFTIGTEGQVKNARIVQADPPGVFDQAALNAVLRFRFKPRVIGTTAVEVSGVQNRIRFRLQPR